MIRKKTLCPAGHPFIRCGGGKLTLQKMMPCPQVGHNEESIEHIVLRILMESQKLNLME